MVDKELQELFEYVVDQVRKNHSSELVEKGAGNTMHLYYSGLVTAHKDIALKLISLGCRVKEQTETSLISQG